MKQFDLLHTAGGACLFFTLSGAVAAAAAHGATHWAGLVVGFSAAAACQVMAWQGMRAAHDAIVCHVLTRQLDTTRPQLDQTLTDH